MAYKIMYLFNVSGATAIEYGLIAGLIGAVLLLGIPYVIANPDILSKGISLAVFGSMVGAFSWSMNRAMSSLDNRAQLFIIELLSSGELYSRQDIVTYLCRDRFSYRLFSSIPVDALATLVKQKQVDVEKGQYKIAVKSRS